MRPPSSPGDLTQTQRVPDGTQRESQAAGLWTFSQVKQSALCKKRNGYIKLKNQGNAEHPFGKMRCECGVPEAEGQMVRNGWNVKAHPAAHDDDAENKLCQIQCDCCDTWQHKHCYALESRSLDDAHACYSCLLEDGEKKLLAKMSEGVRRRRLCWLIERKAVPATEGEFATAAGKASRVFPRKAP